jgi:hypothetical protein
MKKISLIITAALLSTALFAQHSANLGLKGGLNLSSTKNVTAEDETDTKIGFYGGLLAHIHLAPEWAVQPEIVFSRQGTEYAFSTGGQTNEAKINLDYLNIPVVVQYMFNNGFRIETGPQVGFLLNTDAEINDQPSTFVTKRDFKNVDLSWAFGLGYLSKSGIGVGGRYNLGISDINNSPDETDKIKNSVFQIGLFYMFNSAHKAQSK